MIGKITGRIVEKENGAVIVDVSGIGYKIWTPAEVEVGAETAFYTHLHVKEDALDLFGFIKKDELKLFESLLSVSGVGPKTALSVLTKGGSEMVNKAVAEHKPELLSAPGVGKKTAERIVLELSGKLSFIEIDDELKDALTRLGYKDFEAARAAQKIDKDQPLTTRIKEALKVLQK